MDSDLIFSGGVLTFLVLGISGSLFASNMEVKDLTVATVNAIAIVFGMGIVFSSWVLVCYKDIIGEFLTSAYRESRK